MTIIDQIQAIVQENEAMKRDLREAKNSLGQLSDLSYSLVCVCLFSRGEPPSDDALQRTLPPRRVESQEYLADAAEYVRKALLATRSVLTDKINDLSATSEMIKAAEQTMVDAMGASTTSLTPSHTPLAEEEIPDVVHDFVPASIVLPSRPRKASGEKKTRKPWMLT